MDAPQTKIQKDYRRAFILNAVFGGGFLLLFGIASYYEMLYPRVRGTLAWCCLIPSIINLSVASFSYSRYLHAKSCGEESEPQRPYRRTSRVSLFGLPLYDIYVPGPTDDFKNLDAATARGVLAVGMAAKGV